jgi:hypothetical protein
MDSRPASACGPFFRAFKVIEPEYGEVSGHHPRQRMQDVGDPILNFPFLLRLE